MLSQPKPKTLGLIFWGILTACGSNPKPMPPTPTESQKPKYGLLAIVANKDETRLRETLRRQTQFDFIADVIVLTAELQLPQIEIPYRENFNKKYQIAPYEDLPLSALKGFACVRGQIQSTEKKNYLKSPWIIELVVDGRKIKTETTFSQAQILNLDQNSLNPIEGTTHFHVCTTKEINPIQEVRLVVKDKKKNQLTDIQWLSPWPNWPEENP